MLLQGAEAGTHLTQHVRHLSEDPWTTTIDPASPRTCTTTATKPRSRHVIRGRQPRNPRWTTKHRLVPTPPQGLGASRLLS